MESGSGLSSLALFWKEKAKEFQRACEVGKHGHSCISVVCLCLYVCALRSCVFLYVCEGAYAKNVWP